MPKTCFYSIIISYIIRMPKTCSVVPCEVAVAVVLAPHHQVAKPPT